MTFVQFLKSLGGIGKTSRSGVRRWLKATSEFNYNLDWGCRIKSSHICPIKAVIYKETHTHVNSGDVYYHFDKIGLNKRLGKQIMNAADGDIKTKTDGINIRKALLETLGLDSKKWM